MAEQDATYAFPYAEREYEDEQTRLANLYKYGFDQGTITEADPVEMWSQKYMYLCFGYKIVKHYCVRTEISLNF